MKKIFYLLLLTITLQTQAQTVCTQDVQNYINNNITGNGTRSITGAKMNTALTKLITAINCNDSVGGGSSSALFPNGMELVTVSRSIDSSDAGKILVLYSGVVLNYGQIADNMHIGIYFLHNENQVYFDSLTPFSGLQNEFLTIIFRAAEQQYFLLGSAVKFKDGNFYTALRYLDDNLEGGYWQKMGKLTYENYNVAPGFIGNYIFNDSTPYPSTNQNYFIEKVFINVITPFTGCDTVPVLSKYGLGYETYTTGIYQNSINMTGLNHFTGSSSDFVPCFSNNGSVRGYIFPLFSGDYGDTVITYPQMRENAYTAGEVEFYYYWKKCPF